jgi:arylsulfatase A-like enzyme
VTVGRVRRPGRLAAHLIAFVALGAMGACDRSQGGRSGASGSLPGVAPAASEPTASSARARDVILITLDTFRADRLGCHGHEGGLTPNLDRIAAEGTRFAHAMAPMPCTAPSHASLFTGLSPRLCGVTSNFMTAPDSLDTLAERFSRMGFATGALFNAFDFSQIHLVQGFDGYGFDKGRRAERLVPQLRQYLASNRGRRRFTWIHLFIPHGPHDLPEPFAARVTARYDGPLEDDFHSMEKLRTGEIVPPPEFLERYRQRYDAAIAFTDSRVGEIRAAFEAEKAWDDALLLVVSDHGESLEGRTLGFHAPVLNQETLHAAMVWRGPGVPAGRVVDAVAQPMDAVPTLFELLGETIPGELEGLSLAGLITAEDPGDVEWSRYAIAALPTRFEGKGDQDGEAAAIRSGRFLLVFREGRGRALHDVVADPLHRIDLADRHPDVVRALESAFEEWVRATREAPTGGVVSPEMATQLRKLGYQ